MSNSNTQNDQFVIMDEIIAKKLILATKIEAITPALKEIKLLKCELKQDLEDLSTEMGPNVCVSHNGYQFGSQTKNRVSWSEANVREHLRDPEAYVSSHTEQVRTPILKKEKATKKRKMG